MKKCDINNVVVPAIPPEHPNGLKLLLSQILKSIKNMDDETKQKLLEQDADIDTLYNNLKTSLGNSIAEALEEMEASGDLARIITDTVLEDYNALQFEINNNVLFYGKEVYTEKLHDTVSNTDYYVTHVPPFASNGDPLRFQLGIANDDYSCSTLETTLHFAQRKNATIAINAGFFDRDTDKPRAGLIQNGKVIRNAAPTASGLHYITFDKFGNLGCYPGNYDCNRMVAEGVMQATSGRVILIQNNESNTDLPNTDRHPRQAIGQKTTGEVEIITCDGRTIDDNGMTYADLQRIFHDLGCINAYELDGGGSTSTVLREVKQNENIDEYGAVGRPVSNFFYITKPTIPNENQIVNDAFEEIGKLKNSIMERLANSNIIEKGFMRLYGKEGFLQPGIEAYVNGETSPRYGKMGWNADKGYWYAAMVTDKGTQENVLRADHSSVWGPFGQLANLLAYPRTIGDTCDVKGVPLTMFYCIESQTDHAPEIGNCLILHVPFTSSFDKNIRQYAIPLTYDKPFKIRGCSSSGQWNEWKEFSTGG